MFWNIFCTLCSEHNTSPNGVAKELNLSSGSVTSWKNGRVPHHQTLLKIADFFGVTTDYLLGREETTAHKEQSLSKEELKYLRLIEILTDDEKQKLIDYAELLKRGRNQ